MTGKWASHGLVVFIALLLATAAGAVQQADGVARWNFDVYLDEKKVGVHTFTVSEEDGVREVQSEARFDYKLLFISAYRYQHSAAERWSGNCLVEIESKTNTNGDRIAVSGARTEEGFIVERGDAPLELPDCVMTFAYWNPEFLQQPRLLNPQTGDYVDVEVEQTGVESLQVRGQAVTARRYKLTADKLDVTLWYSPANEWLGLESVAKGGRIIRYELS